jgi:hypothetical protein
VKKTRLLLVAHFWTNWTIVNLSSSIVFGLEFGEEMGAKRTLIRNQGGRF